MITVTVADTGMGISNEAPGKVISAVSQADNGMPPALRRDRPGIRHQQAFCRAA